MCLGARRAAGREGGEGGPGHGEGQGRGGAGRPQEPVRSGNTRPCFFRFQARAFIGFTFVYFHFFHVNLVCQQILTQNFGIRGKN